MKKALFVLLLLAFSLLAGGAAAQVSVAFLPEHPRVGDYVDVTVTADGEPVKSVVWALSVGEETIVSEEPTDRLRASFRPRTEADHVLTVTVGRETGDPETVSLTVPVRGTAPVQQGENVIYSQRDGWWRDKVYSAKHHRSVQKAGCALFALSHALQRIGRTGEDILPDALAKTYSYCYVEGRGTANETLISNAAKVYDFYTESDLIESEAGLTTCFHVGDCFSFSIVIGHIAFADQLSEDGTKVHVVDSAPSATFERINDAHVYIRAEDGSFTEVRSPDEIPGIRWFFETGEFGGAEYWLDLKYCAERGMRLIRPAWLKLESSEGPVSVSPVYMGAVWSRVLVGEEELRVRTSSLRWISDTPAGLRMAMVTNRKTYLTDADGKTVTGFLSIQPGTLLPVIRDEKERLYVFYRIGRKQSFGYVKAANTEPVAIETADYPQGTVATLKGKTSGNVEVGVLRAISGEFKNQKTGKWTIGTPVALLKHQDGYYYAEGKGLRGWIDEAHLVLDEAADPEGSGNNGQKVDEGE